MDDGELSTGWIVSVKSSSGQERLFIVAESVQLNALERAKQKVLATEGDEITFGQAVSGEELARLGLQPGDVAPARHGRY
jgi:hypothetical protein